jgi:plasmid stabilization system protein ParE
VSVKYRLAELARLDLQKIWWYAFQFQASDERADALLDRIYATISRIADSPAIGTPRGWAPGQFVFPTGSYLVVYYRDDEGIVVSRVCGADSKLREDPR